MDDHLSSIVLGLDGSLRDALRAIENGRCGIAMVVDVNGKLKGTISDGDIRRAILAGASVDDRSVDQVMRRDFLAVTDSVGRAEIIDMMLARGITQVPVLDSEGRLRSLQLLQKIIGKTERPNWAVIMAGGKGTRLLPLTEATPKPMIPVAGRPILERLVHHLVGSGIRKIFISVNHLAVKIEDHFADGAAYGCTIEYLREKRPLGTGGSLTLLPEEPAHPILVMNGDLLTQVDIGRLLDFHEVGRFLLTLGVRPHIVPIPYGVAKIEETRLVGLDEKPTLTFSVSAGIYVLSPSVTKLIPNNEPFPITDLFREGLRQNLRVGACVIEEDWLDVGQHDDLRRARGNI